MTSVERAVGAEDASNNGDVAGSVRAERGAVGFTPGPWKPDGCLVIAPGFILATVNWHSGYEHGVANARLMSAAPDLYEALRVMVADFADYPASERPCRAFDMARAALTKATAIPQESTAPTSPPASQSSSAVKALT